MLPDRNWTSADPQPRTCYSFTIPIENGRLQQCWVLPGGRWLLTHSSRAMRLWDWRSREEPISIIAAEPEDNIYMILDETNTEQLMMAVIGKCHNPLLRTLHSFVSEILGDRENGSASIFSLRILGRTWPSVEKVGAIPHLGLSRVLLCCSLLGQRITLRTERFKFVVADWGTQQFSVVFGAQGSLDNVRAAFRNARYPLMIEQRFFSAHLPPHERVLLFSRQQIAIVESSALDRSGYDANAPSTDVPVLWRVTADHLGRLRLLRVWITERPTPAYIARVQVIGREGPASFLVPDQRHMDIGTGRG